MRISRNWALLVALFILAACAPAVQPQAPLDGVTLTETQGDGYLTFTLSTDTPLSAVYLRIPGVGLSVNSNVCEAKADAVECVLTASGGYAVTKEFQVSIGGQVDIPENRLLGIVCVTDVCHELFLQTESET